MSQILILKFIGLTIIIVIVIIPPLLRLLLLLLVVNTCIVSTIIARLIVIALLLLTLLSLLSAIVLIIVVLIREALEARTANHALVVAYCIQFVALERLELIEVAKEIDDWCIENIAQTDQHVQESEAK